ncbi:MAG: ATP-binding protein [Brevirhabdus sp.]
MSGPVEKSPGSVAARTGRLILPALVLSFAGLGVSLWRGNAFSRDLFLLMTGILLVLGALAWLGGHGTRKTGKLTRRGAEVKALMHDDPVAGFISCAEGEILSFNPAAQKLLNARKGETVTEAVRAFLSNPSSLIMRLLTKARASCSAQEDVVTRQGHLRLIVRQIGKEEFFWRVELFPQRASQAEGAASISLPMLTVSKSGTVLFMNDALRRLVGRRVRSLDRVFAELPPRMGQINALTTSDGAMDVLVIEGAENGGRRELYLAPAQTQVAHKAVAAAIDGLPVALIKMDRDGGIVASNALAREFLGLTEGDEVRFSDRVEGLGRSVSDWVRMLAQGRGLRRPEVVRVRRTDGELYIQVVPERIVENGDDLILAVLSDVTELKTLEAQVVQSQKMQAIGQLAGGVAHDFNNLLTAITGHCDLLLLRHDAGDADYGDLQQINQNANRAASLVGQLLAFSRKQNLRPERIDLRESLSDLTHLLNRLVGEKIALSLSHDPDLRATRADKQQLEQVIMNLVVNARDAMVGQNGEIRITTSNVTFEADMLRDRATLPAGDYVLVRVSDNGQGIPKGKLTKIFEPFYTTKKTGEGTGLGLSTAYGIVKQTGGFIFVESVVGSGTEFSIYLPAAQTAEEEITTDARPAPAVDGGRGDGVILLVEDETPVRAFASRALRLRGYTVMEADSAEQALQMLSDDGLSVDLFVTDVVMPGRNGPSWVREALKTRPDARVIFVSGYAEESVTEDQSRIPNSVFLQKPFSLADLTMTVQQQLACA